MKKEEEAESEEGEEGEEEEREEAHGSTIFGQVFSMKAC